MYQKGKAAPAEIVHLDWEGPWTVGQVLRAESVDEAPSSKATRGHISRGYGIYQIYGTHSVAGPDSLLYVGRANGHTFSQRVRPR